MDHKVIVPVSNQFTIHYGTVILLLCAAVAVTHPLDLGKQGQSDRNCGTGSNLQ